MNHKHVPLAECEYSDRFVQSWSLVYCIDSDPQNTVGHMDPHGAVPNLIQAVLSIPCPVFLEIVPQPQTPCHLTSAFY